MIEIKGRIMRHSLPGITAVFLLLLAFAASPAPAADSNHGKVLYQTCAACHTERPDALGPRLKAWSDASRPPSRISATRTL